MVFYGGSATDRERASKKKGVPLSELFTLTCMESMDNSKFFLLSRFHMARFLPCITPTTAEGLSGSAGNRCFDFFFNFVNMALYMFSLDWTIDIP